MQLLLFCFWYMLTEVCKKLHWYYFKYLYDVVFVISCLSRHIKEKIKIFKKLSSQEIDIVWLFATFIIYKVLRIPSFPLKISSPSPLKFFSVYSNLKMDLKLLAVIYCVMVFEYSEKLVYIYYLLKNFSFFHFFRHF